jgi:hypothetical protein
MRYGKIADWFLDMPQKRATKTFPSLLWLVFVLPLGFILSACQPSGAVLPTVIPVDDLPTVIALTVAAGVEHTSLPNPTKTQVPTLLAPDTGATATRTSIPTSTEKPTITPTRTATVTRTPTPSSTPTVTPTPTNTPRPEIPLAAIRIQRPAPLSKVISPIEVRAVLAPGAGGIFRVELLGEDGRLLARQVLTYQGERVNASINLDFEIPGVAETGRLQVFTLDAYGRMIALSSTNIILMSVGNPEYNPAGDLRERIFIQEPSPDDLIVGGVLNIFGKARPNENDTLLVELITQDGAVVGQRVVAVQPEAGEDYGIFSAEISYRISEPTQVRLVIYEDIDRIPGKTHISTLEITLNP